MGVGLGDGMRCLRNERDWEEMENTREVAERV